MRGRALDVQPHREVLPVGEAQVRDGIGIEVGQPLLGYQAKLIGGDDRVSQQQRMPGRARIDPVTGQENFLRHGATASHRPAIDHDDAPAGHGQVSGRNEAVVPRTCDDDVGDNGHFFFPR